MALRFNLKTTTFEDFYAIAGSRGIVSEEDYFRYAVQLHRKNPFNFNRRTNEVRVLKEYFMEGLGRKVVNSGCAIELVNKLNSAPEEYVGSQYNILEVNRYIKVSAALAVCCQRQLERPEYIVGVYSMLDPSFTRWANCTELEGDITLYVLMDSSEQSICSYLLENDQLNVVSVDGKPVSSAFEAVGMLNDSYDPTLFEPEKEQKDFERFINDYERRKNEPFNRNPYLLALKKLPDGTIIPQYSCLAKYPDKNECLREYEDFLGGDKGSCCAAGLIIDEYIPNARRLYRDVYEGGIPVFASYITAKGVTRHVDVISGLKRFHELFQEYGKPLSFYKSDE